MKALNGIHHISAITADAAQNLRFYTGLMGMRLVKKTVNQDNPSVYHPWVQGVDATPIPKEAVACDYWNGRNSSCSGLKSELAWLSPQRRRQPASRGARRRAGSCRLAAS